MNPLRNPNINYFKGWFFVTMQVAKNQSAVPRGRTPVHRTECIGSAK